MAFRQQFDSVSFPFNRTSMESKRTSSIWGLSRGYTFNRTSMESKPDISRFNTVPIKAFNRTSMESKQICPFGLVDRQFLLIEPVWNRNAVLYLTSFFRFHF